MTQLPLPWRLDLAGGYDEGMEPGIEERNSQKHWPTLPAFTVATVLLLPLLYVLSIGPVTYLDGRWGVLQNPTVAGFYYPMYLATSRNRQFRNLMGWYARQWEYKPTPAPVPPSKIP